MIKHQSSGPSHNTSPLKENPQTVLPIVRQLPRRVTNPQPRKEDNYNSSFKNLHPKGLSLLWNTSKTTSVEGMLVHVCHYFYYISCIKTCVFVCEYVFIVKLIFRCFTSIGLSSLSSITNSNNAYS